MYYTGSHYPGVFPEQLFPKSQEHCEASFNELHMPYSDVYDFLKMDEVGWIVIQVSIHGQEQQFEILAIQLDPSIYYLFDATFQAMLRSLARCGKVEQRILEMGLLFSMK